MKKTINKWIAFLLCLHTVLFVVFQVSSVVMAENETFGQFVTDSETQESEEVLEETLEETDGLFESEDVEVSVEETIDNEYSEEVVENAQDDVEVIVETVEITDNIYEVSMIDESQPEESIKWMSYAEYRYEEAVKAWNNPELYVGQTAVFNLAWSSYLCSPGTSAKSFDASRPLLQSECIDSISGKSIQVVIADYERASNGWLWYKVEAAEGYTLPEILVDNPYVLHMDSLYEGCEGTFLMQPLKGMFVSDDIYLQDSKVAASMGEMVKASDLPDFFDVVWTTDGKNPALEFYDLGDLKEWSGVTDPENHYVFTTYVTLIPAEVSRAYETLMDADSTAIYETILSYIPEEVTSQFTAKHKTNLKTHLDELHEIENVEKTTTVTIDGVEVPVTVHGRIPQNGELIVKLVDASTVMAEGFDIKDATELITALDIKIIDENGDEWQPDHNERIWVSIGMKELGYEDGSIVRLHHKHGDTIDTFEIFVVMDGKVTVGTSGFSIYAVSEPKDNKITGIAAEKTNIELTVGEPVVFYFNVNNFNYNTIANWFVTDTEGAIFYEVYSNSSIGNSGMCVPWIKIVPLKTTTSLKLQFKYGTNETTETYSVTIVAPKATNGKTRELYLKDTVNQNGCIEATLVDQNGNEVTDGLAGAAFTWERKDGVTDMFIMPQAYEDGNKRINIAKDHGGMLEAKKDTKGNFVHTVYTVTATLASGEELEADYTVYYQSEIINASFEAPDATKSTYTFFPNGWAGMYWKTTGPGTGSNLTRDIEYVDYTDGTNNTNPGFSVSGAAHGVQFAELNAEAFGTLYQDIITSPGEEIAWSFAHAPRPSYSNKMYIVLGATEGAQKLTTQDQLEKLVDAARSTTANSQALDKGEGIEVTYDGTLYAIWYHEATETGKWITLSGSYEAPEGQYRTRAFFMSETPANKQNQNFGNIIDSSKVGQYKKMLIEYYEETFDENTGSKSVQHYVSYDEVYEALVYSSVPLANLESYFEGKRNDYLHQILINGSNYPYNIRYAGDASIFVDKYSGKATDPFPNTGKSYSDYDIVVQIYLRDTIIAVQKKITFPTELTDEQKMNIITQMNNSTEGSYEATFKLIQISGDKPYSAEASVAVTHRDPKGEYTAYKSLGDDPPLGVYVVEETKTTPIVGLELAAVVFRTTLYSYGTGDDPIFEGYGEKQVNKIDDPLRSDQIALITNKKIAEVEVENIYKEKMTTISYEAVGNGKVAFVGDRNLTFQDTPTETIKFYSEKAKGAEIHPGNGANFAGWYKDEECTVLVTDADGVWNRQTNSFKPNANIINTDNITFYAKFETGSIEIVRTNAEPGQIFVYHIQSTGTDVDPVDMYVTVQCDENGNGKTEIFEVPAANYTVTEVREWSWRYDTASKGPTAAGTGKVTFNFNESMKRQTWLNGFGEIAKNVYKVVKVVGGGS